MKKEKKPDKTKTGVIPRKVSKLVDRLSHSKINELSV